jgi:predicted GH43/DUF377 family glycosyl hydrolase
MKLKKYSNNPILSPNLQNDWENLVACNPAAIYKDGHFYLYYRAAGDDPLHHVHIGVAVSEDGYHFERMFNHPVLSPTENGFDEGTVEDPRVVAIGNELYMTYAFRPHAPGQYWKYEYDKVLTPDYSEYAPKCLRENIGNSALAISKDYRHFKKVGRLTDPSMDDRDVILFPEPIHGVYYLIHRPKDYVGDAYGTNYPAIWIKSSKDLMSWGNETQLLMKGEQPWEIKIGGCAPPVRTEEGWLFLYHGVDKYHTYRVGACLLDLDNPTKVLYRTKHFIMEPETKFEKDGLYKWGVVFPTGTVVKDNTLYVYYGASDQWCCVATCDVNELIDYIKKDSL